MDIQTKRLKDHMNELLEKHGYVVLSVLDQGVYTIGFKHLGKMDLISPTPGSSIAGLVSVLSELNMKDELVTDKPLECDAFHVNDMKLRYIIKTLSEKESEEVLKRFALGEVGSRFGLVQVGDGNNLLPDEEGYDWVDQTLETLYKKVEAEKKGD